MFEFLIFLISEAKAEEPLMLSREEQHAVDQFRRQSIITKKKQPSMTVRLDGILYFNQEQWTIWINGKSYGVGDDFEYGHIVDVGKDQVKVYIHSLHQEIILKLNHEISVRSKGLP